MLMQHVRRPPLLRGSSSTKSRALWGMCIDSFPNGSKRLQSWPSGERPSEPRSHEPRMSTKALAWLRFVREDNRISIQMENLPLFVPVASPAPTSRRTASSRPRSARRDSADIAGKGDAADKKGTRDPLEKYLRDRFARRFRRNPDPALLARLATILDTRGASVDNFIAHVNEKDQRDPIQSYGLLFALAGECSKVDASPAEVDVVLTPSQMEHHAIFRRDHRGKER